MAKILIFFIIASAIQGFLYMKQQRKVNELFYTLREKGNVLVGMKKGWLRSGAIVLILLKENIIHEAYTLQGKSVFAKVKPLNAIEGKALDEVEELDDEGLDKAFQDAYRRYTDTFTNA